MRESETGQPMNHMPSVNIFRSAIQLVGVVVLLVSTLGCGGSRGVVSAPDDTFGHRVEGQTSDGRVTSVITPPDSELGYGYFPAVFDTIHVRHELVQAVGEEVRVEVLVKGSFPDSCTDLHNMSQSRAENLVTVNLNMRRPQGVMCASVVRPYRYYVMLDGTYGLGHYRLRVNDKVRTFVIGAAS